jgi:hypothetical protein
MRRRQSEESKTSISLHSRTRRVSLNPAENPELRALMIRGYKECSEESRQFAGDCLPLFVEILERLPYEWTSAL